MKDIEGFEGLYAVTEDGRVWCTRKGGFWLKPSRMKSCIWYLSASLWKNKKYHAIKIHRLVAKAFIPNSENKPEVNHKNGVKDDNRVENLEWVTRKENRRHAFKNGLIPPVPRGEENAASKYSNELIKEIREAYLIKKDKPKKCHLISYRKLAKKYGMSKTNIESIITRNSWTHI